MARSSTPSTGWKTELRAAIPFAGIVVLALVVYWPAVGAEFVWDDDDWLTANPLITEPGGLLRIWTTTEALQFYPLLFTSFWLEHRFWGFDPTGYHLVNILLHAANAFLVFRILRSLELRGAAWVALLFLVHPVHVESVAWITERKNVLSGLFYLSAMLAYLRFDRSGRRRTYGLALLLFGAAVLSKTATVTLPVALALTLVWRRRRLARRDLLGLAPFFAVGLTLAAVTVFLEEGLIDAVRPDFVLSGWQRVNVAARALLFYPSKLVVPHPLIFNYPRWDPGAGGWAAIWPAAAVAALGLAVAWAFRRGRRGVVWATLYYVATIAPALGFLNVYAFRYSFVADHFQYLASLGILVLAVEGALAFPLPSGGGARRVVGRGVGVSAIVVLAALAWSQSRAYRDEATLWEDTLAKNPHSWIAHHNLGLLRLGQGDLDGAERHLERAIDCKPGSAESHTGRALVRAARGRTAAALQDLDAAVALSPGYPLARLHRGRLRLEARRFDAAIEDLSLFLDGNPDTAVALGLRGKALLALGRPERALGDLDRAVALGGGSEAYLDRGTAHLQLGRHPQALADAERAVELADTDPRPLLLHGAALQAIDGDPGRACADWERACRLGDCRYELRYCSGASP